MKRVFIISPRGHGGISAVVDVYIEHGLFAKFDIELISSYKDSSVSGRLGIFLLGYWRFCRQLLMRRVKLVHIHTASYVSFWRKSLFFVAARSFGVPCIVHLHGGKFHVFYNGLGPQGRSVVRYVLDHAAVIIVLSESWARWIGTVSTNRNVAVVSNAIQAPPEAVNPAGPRRTSCIVFLGLVASEKGVYDLLEAIRIVRQECPTARLLIAGDGELDKTARRVEENDSGDYVELLGWVAGPDKARLLCSAAVFCLPSYNEGLPMSILEAMAAALPVVTTPVGGIPEAITDGVEGFLVEPGNVQALADKLIVLLRDPELATRMGQQARQKALSKYSVEKLMPVIEGLYEDLGAKPRQILNIEGAKQHP